MGVVQSQNDQPQNDKAAKPEAKNVVGPQVKHFRTSKGWTQEQLAARCNLLCWDISRSTLSKIEARGRKISDKEIALLAKALNVGIEQLYP